jgi:hypothetical protein
MPTATATITREQLDDIFDAAGLYETDEDERGDWDSDVIAVRENYSGRGMFGDKCLGFVVSSQHTAYRLIVGMAEVLGTDEALEIVRRGNEDSMGRDMIVYFPGVTLDA